MSQKKRGGNEIPASEILNGRTAAINVLLSRKNDVSPYKEDAQKLTEERIKLITRHSFNETIQWKKERDKSAT